MQRAKMDRGVGQAVRGVFTRVLAIMAYIAIPHQLVILLHRLRGVHIGREVFIGRYVYIDERNPEQVFIGNGIAVSAGARILVHQRDLSQHGEGDWVMQHPLVVKPVHIEDGAHIGIGATILPGVTVGRGAVVGAGAVVTKDVEPYTLVVGVPAKPIKVFGRDE